MCHVPLSIVALFILNLPFAGRVLNVFGTVAKSNETRAQFLSSPVVVS